jgi:hypothetical protein
MQYLTESELRSQLISGRLDENVLDTLKQLYATISSIVGSIDFDLDLLSQTILPKQR